MPDSPQLTQLTQLTQLLMRQLAWASVHMSPHSPTKVNRRSAR
ncbi:hypothetical protein OG194_43600 [Streptomyces sp. NBC_01288]|nr:hypothetical protein OG194_43600 [Streptomyces sp. NBC_01288]